MRDIYEEVSSLLADGKEVALATVVRTWGSSPRSVGACMSVTADRRIAGSVSGGCIEGAVIQSALQVLEDGKPRLEKFHASMKQAHEVGLSCGGDIDIFIRRLDHAIFERQAAGFATDQDFWHFMVIDAPEEETGRELSEESMAEEGMATSARRYIGAEALLTPEGYLFGAGFDVEGQRVLREMTTVLPELQFSGTFECALGTVFYHRELPKPQLVCVGGVHIAIPLTRMAKMMGYRTVVVDPRAIFNTSERFPWVDELVHEWPEKAFQHVDLNASTAVCALTHDTKIDVPALALAVRSKSFFVGCLGRPSTQVMRRDDLLSRGILPEEIGRIYGPIGLDLGGRNPDEIALSIIAEITAARYGRGCGSRMMDETCRAEEQRSGGNADKATVSCAC